MAAKVWEMISGPQAADLKLLRWALEFYVDRTEGKPVNVTDMRVSQGSALDDAELREAIAELRARHDAAQAELEASSGPLVLDVTSAEGLQEARQLQHQADQLALTEGRPVAEGVEREYRPPK